MGKFKETLSGIFYSIKPYQLGVAIFIVFLILGYLDFRIHGEGAYNAGQSDFAALPKGMDFKAVHNYTVSLKESFDAYLSAKSTYPPFVVVLYFPFSFLSANSAYQLFCVIVLLTLFFMFYTILSEYEEYFSEKNNEKINRIVISLIMTFIICQTYPMNFALERGNYDIIAATLASIALLATIRQKLILSTILLAISTQLKVYPAILIILLFSRFRLKGLLYYIFFNVILLFSLGPVGLKSFFVTLGEFTAGPFIWPGNHSLASYVRSFELFSPGPVNWMRSHKEIIILFFMLFTAAFFAILYFRFLNKSIIKRSDSTKTCEVVGFSAKELGIIGLCFTIMSLLPTTSHDYKLVIQLVPILFVLSRSWTDLFLSKKAAAIFIILLSSSIAYLFLPRFIILPYRMLGVIDPIAEMKTPALLVVFICYLFLTLFGKSDPKLNSSGKDYCTTSMN